jgi:hypothetical protein
MAERLTGGYARIRDFHITRHACARRNGETKTHVFSRNQTRRQEAFRFSLFATEASNARAYSYRQLCHTRLPRRSLAFS